MRRKSFLAALAIAGCFSLNAQTDLTDRTFVYGSLGLNSSSSVIYDNSGGSSLDFNISAGVGRYFYKKLAIGLFSSFSRAGYSNTYSSADQDNSNYYGNLTYSLSAGPFARYTVPLNDRFLFNLMVSLPYTNTQKTTTSLQGVHDGSDFHLTDRKEKTISNGLGANVSPSVMYFLTEKIALTGGLGSFRYTWSTSTTDATSVADGQETVTQTSGRNSQLNFSLFNSLTLGLTWFVDGAK